MDTLLMFVFCIGIIAGFVLMIAIIINVIKKKPVKQMVVALGISVAVSFTALVTAALLDPDNGSDSSEEKIEVSAETVETTEAEDGEKAEASDNQSELTSDSDNDAFFTESSESLSALDDIDTQISDILIEKGYSIEHASSIQEILNIIGIDTIYIQSMTGEAEKGLNSVVTYPKGYVCRVKTI